MLKGTYIFYQDGKEIARAKNVITKFGKRYFTNVISGGIPSFTLDMAFGVDSTAAAETDTRLGFEFYRTPVLFGSTDIQTTSGVTTYSVVYKTTLPQDVIAKINEIGIYPSNRSSANNFDSKYISEFSDHLDWTTSTGLNPDLDNTSGNYRIGGNSLVMSANSGTPREYKASIPSLDISGYSVNDSIKIAYYKEDTNLSTIKIRLYSESANYYEYTLTPASGTGYKISPDIPLSSFFSSPTNSATAPDQQNINQVGVIITSSSGLTEVGIDGLRINDEDTFDPTYGLLSRAIISTLDKKAGRPVDVEYRLDLGF